MIFAVMSILWRFANICDLLFINLLRLLSHVLAFFTGVINLFAILAYLLKLSINFVVNESPLLDVPTLILDLRSPFEIVVAFLCLGGKPLLVLGRE